MPLLPYLSAAAAAGLSYIIRSGPECFPQSQSSDHISSGYSILSPLYPTYRLLKSPHASSLSNTHTPFCVPTHQAQNTLAKPGVNHYTKSSLQSPVSSQRAVGRRGWTWTTWLIEEGGKNFSFGQKTREENWGQSWKELEGWGATKEGGAKEKKRSWKIKKKGGKNAPRCLASFTKSSKLPWQCHGNSRMFPDPEHHGNDVVAHRGMLPPSLPRFLQILWISAEISRCVTVLLFWRLEGHNLQWVQLNDVINDSVCECGTVCLLQHK